MVEKVDKPQAPPAYQILPTKEAKDDQSRKQEQEEGEEHYQKSDVGADWGKYRGRAMTIKPVRVARDRIDRVLFRNTVLKSGMGILEASVVWKDGRTTEPVLFLLPRPEDYMKLRLMKRGQTVPDNFWAKGDQIDMGIVQMEPQSGSWSTKDLSHEAKARKAVAPLSSSLLSKIGLVDRATRKFQWLMLLVYLVAISIVVLATVFAFR